MRFTPTPLAGCFIVDIDRKEDERGFFARTFCAREFMAAGLVGEFVQSSVSFNKHPLTLRGLHFERGAHMEEKLVSCHAGAVFDVAVDIRPGSPTFGRWTAAELTAENFRMFYLPRGFAHGFLTLRPESVVAYEIARFYEPGHSAGIHWSDADIGVEWPHAPIVMSQRDKNMPLLRELSEESG